MQVSRYYEVYQRWRHDPQGFWAELECAFLNTYQLRWQYTSAAIGLGLSRRNNVQAHSTIKP